LAELEVMLKSLVAEEESYKRLMEIPGVGLIEQEFGISYKVFL
jgi:hypothetical protein